jgi:hypothetical protein
MPHEEMIKKEKKKEMIMSLASNKLCFDVYLREKNATYFKKYTLLTFV